MYFIWIVYVAVLLRASVQILVSASLNHVEDIQEVSADKIVDYVTLPWMEARDWLLHSSESSRVKEVRAFVRGVEFGETWALEMLDGLRKIQKETPQRNIQEIATQDQSIMVNAQHYHINIRKRSCGTLHSGIVSSSVSDARSKYKPRATQIVNNAAQGEPPTSESDLGASGSLLPRLQFKDLVAVEITTIIFILTIGAFMIGCTICDIVRRINHRGELSATVIMLSKCSLYTNALAILSTEATPDMMPAIHGIRFLSSCHVIILHRYLISMLALGKSITLLDFLKDRSSWIVVFIEMGPYAVDTFFVISGFLAAYQFSKSMQSGIKFNLPKMYLHRYVRITPCLGALILCTGIFAHRAGSGPLWEITLNYSINHCKASWWLQLFYVQNLVKDGFMCLAHTWSLAVDMQLFWITSIILYPLHRWPKNGLGVLRLFFAASIATPAAIVAIYGYSNAIVRIDTDASRWAENFHYYYIPTYNRACPYLVGILLGYDVATKIRRLTQVNVVVNWLITGTLLLLCVWFSNRTWNTNFAYNSYVEIGFAVLSRPSWAFAMAWIVYACTQGYGGRRQYFRHGYEVLVITIFALETSADHFGSGMLYGVCVDLVVSIVIAFVLNSFIESPVIILTNILMEHGGQAERTTAVKELKKKRKASWWLQLLYVQNLVKDGFMCLMHTWSLAVDMQLFWITSIILYSLNRWPKIGLGVLRLLLAASIATPAVIVAIYGYSNAIVRVDTDASRWAENLQYYYIPTSNRACPYLVGILLGYDVATKRRRLTQVNVVVNWLVTGTLLLLCVWFNHRTYNTNFAYNLYVEIGFAVLSRPSWAFAMAWIVYACTQGYGGMATRFLSLPIFFPLSRLSFCIYLVHVWVQAITIFPLETTTNYFGFGMLYGICVDLVVSIVVAFVFNSFIESPVIVLAKILMKHGGQAEKTTAVEELKKKRK